MRHHDQSSPAFSFSFSGLLSGFAWIGHQVRTKPLQMLATALSAQATFVGATSVKQDTVTDGLVAYYPFTDGSVADFSGNGHHGTIVGNVVPAVDVNGIHNYALAFDGASYIKGSSTGFPSDQRTVSLWFYDGTGTHNPTLMAYGGNPCGTSFMMSINNQDNPGTYDVQGHCRVDRVSSPYQTYPNYQWHHWVVVSDGTGTQMYLDMQKIASSPVALGHTNTHGREFSIGVNVSPSSGMAPYIDANIDYFIGALDEVRVYDRALPPTEIGQLFYGHLQRDLEDSSLVAYYQFEGDADNSVNAQHAGAVTGAQLISSPFGQAYQFNGVSDYIVIPASPTLEPPDLTVAFWVKFACPLSGDIELLIDSSHGGYSGWSFQYLHNYYPGHPNMIGFGYGINQDGFSSWHGAEYQQDFCDDQWHHIVGFINDQSINLQIDGVLRKSNSLKYNGVRTPSGRNIQIGSWWRPDNPRFLSGNMDEVRIYNRALSPQEATLLYWQDYFLHIAPSLSPSTSPSSSMTLSPSNSISTTGTGTVSVSRSSTDTVSVMPSSSATPSPSPSASISATVSPSGSIVSTTSTTGSVSKTTSSSGTMTYSITPSASLSPHSPSSLSSVSQAGQDDEQAGERSTFKDLLIASTLGGGAVLVSTIGFWQCRKRCKGDSAVAPVAVVGQEISGPSQIRSKIWSK